VGWSTNNGQTIWWWGEKRPYHGEELHNGSALSTGFHNFRLLAEDQWYPGQYDLYVDGTLVITTNYAHSTGTPGFNGEIDNTCGRMDGLAERNPSPPYGTLWYHGHSEGWAAWQNDNRGVSGGTGSQYFTSHGTPYDTTIGTDFAYGGQL
jgi:hypothetical protein